MHGEIVPAVNCRRLAVNEGGREAAGKIRSQKLSDKEANLIFLIRGKVNGEIKIIIQDKQPTRVVEIRKSIKL